jgi:LysR family transcriptional regulator, hydrogen peroxide-inducible genes activator
MNLRDFEYLLAVARLRHFGRAAAACNVSQPTLSMQIKKLEDTLGLPLFERGRGDVRLTLAGQDIAARAENILNETKAIREIARQHRDPLAGSLTLGAFPTLAPFLFPRVVPGLNKAFPDLKLYLVEEKTAELLRRLRAGSLDLALIAIPAGESDLDHIKVLEEPFLVAVSKENPLASKRAIDLNDLRKETLLLLEDSHCLTGQALQVCGWAASKEAREFRATSLETLRQMVASNLGVTLVPQMAEAPAASLAYRPLAPSARAGREVGLYWRKSSPFAAAFTKLAAEIERLARKKN